MADAADAPVSGVPPPPGYRQRYPWHDAAWTALARDADRLPHALLLHGPQGLGKNAFAWRLARALLCPEPTEDGNACGACRGCGQFAAGTHPDLLHVTPAEDTRAIAIDQIRGLRDFAALRAHTSRRKLALLEPAEAMTLNAANALLKLLEEPPADSTLALISSAPARLPATIRSRCTSVPFRPPPVDSAAAWLLEQGVAEDPRALLALSGGAPLRALELAASGALDDRRRFLQDVEALRAGTEDPLRCAARWKSYGAERCLEWLQRHLTGLIRGGMTQAGRVGAGKNTPPVKDLFGCLDVVSETRSLLPGPLDELLVLEDISVAWSQLFGKMD